jgi:hypothetical protein
VREATVEQIAAVGGFSEARARSVLAALGVAVEAPVRAPDQKDAPDQNASDQNASDQNAPEAAAPASTVVPSHPVARPDTPPPNTDT